MARRISGDKIKVTYGAHIGRRVTAYACRTDVKQSRGWRKRWCAWEVGDTKKIARRKAVKTLLRKIYSRRK
jgi:hypothetical protein